MPRRSRTSLRLVAVAIACAGLNLQAQVAASLDALMKQRDAAIRQLQATEDSQKADLFDKYANALGALLKQFTVKGDLEGALVVKAEIESARTKRAAGTGTLSALDSYRATLAKSVESIEANTEASQSQINAGYVKSLYQMKVDFTKAGKLDEAVTVDKEIKNVVAGTAPSIKTATPAPAAPSSAAASKSVDFEKPVVDEVTLPPATSRPRNQVQAGRQPWWHRTGQGFSFRQMRDASGRRVVCRFLLNQMDI